MAKISLEERMKSKFNAVKVEKKIELVNIDNCGLETIEFIDDIEINDYLNNKGKEILKMNASGSLFLGKIFTEVQEKLIEYDDEKSTTYCKWLDVNGYNRMTALRHKRRYELYELCKTQKGKTIISLLTVREIEKIYKAEESISNFLSLCDEEANNFSDIKILLKEIKYTEPDIQSEIEFTNYGIQEKYNDVIKRLNGYKMDRIDEKKQEKLNKYLEKIEKLLK